MRSMVMVCVALFALIVVPSASPFGGPEPNPNAVTNCEANIAKQTASGITAGGGSKEGIPAPTNCDHFFH
jgi:hypothetical protein